LSLADGVERARTCAGMNDIFRMASISVIVPWLRT